MKNEKARSANGSMVKVKNGWKATVTIGYDENGNQKRRSKTKKTQKEVNAWLMEISLNADNLDLLNDDVIFLEVAQRWLKSKKDKNVAKSTYSNYTNVVGIISTFTLLWNCKIKNARTVHVEDIMNSLAENHAKSYVRLIKNTISYIFEFAVDNDIIVKNPVKKAQLPMNYKETKKKDTFDEYEVEVLEKYHALFYFGDIIYIMINSGMRSQEICALDEKDLIDKQKISISKAMTKYANNCWEIGKTKTKHSNRLIPINPITVNLIQQRILLTKAHLDNKGQKIPRKLLGTVENDFITYSAFSYRYSEFFKELNHHLEQHDMKQVRYLPPHCCRHTFASRLKQKNISPFVVAELLGHANIEMTARYTHVTPKEMENAMIALAQ